ncbi:MAG TPA: hypothetical protein VMT53_27555 [Terriglobales bacterium]|nr:hypothetical protein [Terriglobales bacterium]
MSRDVGKYLKLGSATVVILLVMGYLAYTGVRDNKSYYVTIKELRGMGDSTYAKHQANHSVFRSVRIPARVACETGAD